jgi:acyl carrier protein
MQSAVDRSVFDRVVGAIGQTTATGTTPISLSTQLARDLGLGRLGRLSLALYLEEIFDLELPNEVVEQFVTVADIVAYFGRRYFRDQAFPALAA